MHEMLWNWIAAWMLCELTIVINNLNWICTWRIIYICVEMVLCNVCNCHLFQCCFTCLCSVLYFSWIKIFHDLQWRFTHLWLNDWPIFTFIQRGVSMGVCLKLGQELSGGKMNWRGRLTGLGRPECREEPFEGFTQDFWIWIWNSLFSVFWMNSETFLSYLGFICLE